eukprot:Em0015g1015a
MGDDNELFKFPRTKHLFDAGGQGVSRDDLLMDAGEEALFYTRRGAQMPTRVTIEEKVDGANIGISIGSDMRISVQNRSHYVNSKTHKQFGSLDKWLDDHSAALFQVLEPGRHVLFGEWLYAKHSIHYTQLPGYFMAFDIFDKQEGRFYSRRMRNEKLDCTGIPVVREIAETTLLGRQEALKWLDTPSAFYDGPCEGIYLRIDEDTPNSAHYTRQPVPQAQRQTSQTRLPSTDRGTVDTPTVHQKHCHNLQLS